MKNLLLFGALGFIAYNFLRGKVSAGENLRVEPLGIQFDGKRSSFTRIYFNIRLRLVNPDLQSIVLRNILLKINSPFGELGSIESSDPFTVGAGKSENIIVSGSVGAFGLVNTIINLIKDKKPLPVSVEGFLNTDLGRVPVAYNQNISIPGLS